MSHKPEIDNLITPPTSKSGVESYIYVDVPDEFISTFEVELLNLINKHIDKGLPKSNLVSKMKYVTKSVELS